jgi:biopolymer transport protein ExbB
VTLRFLRGLPALLALVAGCLLTSPAYAWWNDDWAFRKELSFDLSAAGAGITENVSDVPVLVRLSLANFTYFVDAKPDGSDLRFIAADDKTPLKFHIEKFDSQAQIALLWVRVPVLAAGAATDKIFLYYGNPEATGAADPAGSYDASQSLVYHFGAAAGQPQDSTSFRTEPAVFDAEVNPAALIGAAVRFSGSQQIQVPSAPQFRVAADKGVTVSAWLKPDGAQQSRVLSLSEGARELVLSLDGLRPSLRWRDGASEAIATASAELRSDWQHVAIRANAANIELLVDGVTVAQAAARLPEFTPALTVGAAEGGYRGELDELQYAAIRRGDGAVRAAALSQGMVAPLLVYGGDAQNEGEASHEGYLATTLRSVTVDGWVIIVVLAIMFVASVLIMITKQLFLSAVTEGNRTFLRDFHRMKDDPAAIEKHEGANGSSAFSGAADSMNEDSGRGTYGKSTLWRLYHHGMRETMARLDAQQVSADRGKTLSPQSIAAIRATMDASMTRMTQQLQSQMVWLTISIAGGPFLGLLGTVVGVMITFAAIAVAGDVNVNAIAPGTAAALVATVAGLGVAIPCLFGYNYLNTKVREIANDMRVFVDEFVTRIAETYS